MKFAALCSLFLLGALFLGPTGSLEAKHRNYFSFNVGPMFAPAPAYVVQPYPAYVEQRTYVDAWGYPYREAVVVQPAPQVVYAQPAPISFGFGWMFR